MSAPTFNPHEYCPACGTRWGVGDESCDYCGLDPVNNETDAEFYEKAVQLWKQMQALREPD